LPLARESLEVQKRVYGEDSVNVAMATSHLGFILWRTGHAAEAEPTLQDARARLQVLGPPSGQMASALDGLDHLAEARGDREAALAYARERLAIFDAGGEKAQPYLADARDRVEALSEE